MISIGLAVVSLPQELERDFWQEVAQLQEERRMPYITSVERIGFERGVEESLQQIRPILLESIEMGLQLKFGSDGLRVLPEISELENVEELRLIIGGLKTVNTLDELRQIYLKSAG